MNRKILNIIFGGLLVVLVGSRASSQSSTEQVDSLNTLAKSFRTLNLDSMDHYAQMAFEMANQINYVNGKVVASESITTRLILQGEYSKAIDILFEGKLELDTIRYPRETAIIDYNIGMVFLGSQNQKAGLPYLNEALERFRSTNDQVYFLRCLNNIGVAYIRLEQFDKALKIFEELEELKDQLEVGGRTTLQINLAYCHYGLNDFENAKNVLNHFLSLPLNEVDERGYGFAYFKQGEIFKQEGNSRAAISSFKSALQVFEKFKTEPNKIEVYNGLAEVYFSQGDFTTALINVNKGLAIASKKGILLYEKLLLNTRYKILKSQGKYEEAIDAFERLKVVSDSLVETQQSAEMGRITAQYEFNQQRNELRLQQQQAELDSQEKLNRQQLTIQVSVIAILAIIILLAVLYRSYSLKIRSFKMLTEKNKEIKNQRDQLRASNKVKNKLFSIIGHDLRSPISSLNGLLNLVKNKIANKEDLENILPKLIDNFDKTSTLLNNLLSWTTSQMEGYTLEFTDFNIKTVLERVIENARLQLEDKSIDITFEGDSTIVHGEENMLEIICHNLLSNAIKFCEENDLIEVKITQADKVRVSIKDSGIGMSEERIKTILNDNNFSSTQGTHKEIGSGLGLTICKDFLQKNNSELHIESKPKEGSVFYFYLPKSYSHISKEN